MINLGKFEMSVIESIVGNAGFFLISKNGHSGRIMSKDVIKCLNEADIAVLSGYVKNPGMLIPFISPIVIKFNRGKEWKKWQV